MRSLARVLRAAWWRRGTSAAVVVVAALCVAGAVVGPLYARSASTVVLRDALGSPAPDTTAVQVQVPATRDAAAARTLAARLPPASSTPGYPQRILGLQRDGAALQPLTGPGGPGYAVVAARDGQCARVRLTAGHCPRRTGEVMVGARSAAALSWRIGTVLVQQETDSRTPMNIVGLYDPRDVRDPWWVGLPVVPSLGSDTDLAAVEPVLTAPATLDHQWLGGPLSTGQYGKTLGAARFVAASATTCGSLRLVAGRCPVGSTQAALSARTATRLHLRIGSTVGIPVSTAGTSVRVVGLYAPKDPTSRFWAEPGYLADGPGRADLVVVDPATFGEQVQEVTGTVTMPLEPDQIGLANLPVARTGIDTLTGTAARLGGDNAVRTGIGSVLTGFDRDRAALQTLVLLVVAQLLLLAWFVLYLVVAGVTESRAGEVALAKLRGLRTGQTLRFGLAEPVLLLILAVPLGFALAWGLTVLLARETLGNGVGVRPDLLALAATAVALAGALVAVVLAARRVLTRPVLDQWRRSGGDRAGRRGFTPADGIVVALAAAGLFELRAGSSLRASQGGTVAVLGPALLAVAIAVVGVRLLPVACRVGIGLTRAGHGVGTFVAVRQVARRPAGLRLVALLAVAISLAWFAAAASGVAAHNRTLRAGAELGADRVLSVAPGSADLVSAVRHADPSGQAMAVGILAGDNGAPALLAVDSTRLVAAARWLPGYGGDPRQLARRLRPAADRPAPVFINGGRLTVPVAAMVTNRNGVPAGEVGIHVPAVLGTLAVSYVDNTGRPATVTLGSVRPAAAHGVTPPLSAEVPCQVGCRVTGLTFAVAQDGPVGATYSMVFPGSTLGESTGWKDASVDASTNGVLLGGLGPQGFQFSVPASNGSAVQLARTDRVDTVAAVTTSAVGGRPPYPTSLATLDGHPVGEQIVAHVSRLPVVGTHGQLVDLGTAEQAVVSRAHAAAATYQVWAAPGAPADLARRLRAAGISVLGERTVAAREAQLSRQAPALALRLFALAALAAAVLAAAATAMTTYLTARRRGFELATLSALAYGRRTLLGAALGEQVLLLAAGLVLGALGGFVGTHLALGQIPLFSDRSPLPVDLAPDVPRLALLVVGLVVLVAVTAVGSALLLVRSARPARLRETAA